MAAAVLFNRRAVADRTCSKAGERTLRRDGSQDDPSPAIPEIWRI